VDRAKLAAARLWATAQMPYLASAIFASEAVNAPDSGTISVDRGWRLHADPQLVDALEIEALGRLLIHLCGHLVRDHGSRAQRLGVAPGHGAGRWNRCADAEINDDLAAGGLWPERTARDLPADLGCEAGRIVEAYWEDAEDGPRHWDCGSGADGCERAGESQPGQGEGDAGMSAQQGDLVRLGVAAEIQRTAAQEPGSVPGGWLRWAESVRPSQIDWRKVLAAEIRSAVAFTSGMVDYSYRRPSRRSVAGVIMPTLQRQVPDVAVVIDTSGSMHGLLLERALAEVEGVLRRAGLRGGQLRVLAVDTHVHAVKRVTSARQVALAGGGGTDMGQGIADAAALKPRPSVIIVLTDGFTPWPAQPPRGVRVIVGLLAQGRMPPSHWNPPSWARTVVIDE
jgi:predicted metal-dependent peptidase